MSLLGYDPEVIPSLAKSFRSVSSIKFIDVAAVNEAAKSFQSLQPVVAPQIAEALSQILNLTVPSKAIDAMSEIPAFKFAKTLENFDLSAMKGITESLQTLDIPKVFGETAFSLRDLPPVATADLAARFERVAEEAVVLAEADDLAEAVDEGVRSRLSEMSPAKRRELALDVVVLVGAFLLLASWLMQSQDDPKDVKVGIGLFLACAATYIRIYWRLIGKLDE